MHPSKILKRCRFDLPTCRALQFIAKNTLEKVSSKSKKFKTRKFPYYTLPSIKIEKKLSKIVRFFDVILYIWARGLQKWKQNLIKHYGSGDRGSASFVEFFKVLQKN
uniref:Uncharacterized protein n=1 Tax=Photinus pyralis TaxID=7054 RepID=A0A1Y1LVV8_PHOPY